MNKKIKFFITLFILVAVVALFYAASVIATTDAQGAFVFIIALPLCGGLLIAGYFLTETKSILQKMVLAEAIFLALFFICIFIPPLRFFPGVVIEGSARSFQYITGMNTSPGLSKEIKNMFS